MAGRLQRCVLAAGICLPLIAGLPPRAATAQRAGADGAQRFLGDWQGPLRVGGIALRFTEYAQIEETMSPALLNVVSAWILERFGPGR